MSVLYEFEPIPFPRCLLELKPLFSFQELKQTQTLSDMHTQPHKQSRINFYIYQIVSGGSKQAIVLCKQSSPSCLKWSHIQILSSIWLLCSNCNDIRTR